MSVLILRPRLWRRCTPTASVGEGLQGIQKEKIIYSSQIKIAQALHRQLPALR